MREYIVLGFGVFVAVAPGVVLFPHYVGDPANPANIIGIQLAFVPFYIATSLFVKSRMPSSAMPALLRFAVLSAAASLISWAMVALGGDTRPLPVPAIVAPMFDFRGPNAMQAEAFELWCEYWLIVFAVLYTADGARRQFRRSTPDPDRQ